MNKDIILAGVGGQGILSISYIVCSAALKMGWNFKQAEVHGMSQRGGQVQAHLRLSDKAISSDLVPEGGADLVLSVEPLESLRYVQYLSPDGFIVSSTTPFVNIPNYPDLEGILERIAGYKNHTLVDSAAIARIAGSVRAQNMVCLGAAADYIGIAIDHLKEFITELFSAKGEKVIETNHKAIEMGHAVGKFFAACISAGLDPLATRILTGKAHPDSLNPEHASKWEKAFESNRAGLIEAIGEIADPFNATGEKADTLSETCSDLKSIVEVLTS